MRLCVFAATAVVCLLGVAAHADTLTTYEVTNRSGVNGIGAITVDSTLGKVTNLNVAVPADGSLAAFEGAPLKQGFNVNLFEYTATFNGTTDALLFSLPVSTLVGFVPTGSSACAVLSFTCDYLANVYTGTISTGGPIDTFEGNFAPAATGTSVTPEPSSIALLGTGLLGLAGWVRRRSV